MYDQTDQQLRAGVLSMARTMGKDPLSTLLALEHIAEQRIAEWKGKQDISEVTIVRDQVRREIAAYYRGEYREGGE